MMPNGPEYVASLRECLSAFYEGASEYMKAQGLDPVLGSQAAKERGTFPRPDSLFSASALASFLIESSGEHVTAFVKTIVEPIESIACWTCVRSMLESSALAAWLLDPGLDTHVRVGRVYALRYEGMEQETKFGTSAGVVPPTAKGGENRIDKVEREAISLGYKRLRNKNGERIGIGQIMPAATTVIKMMLNEETAYRLLSAVAHGHFWAIHQLSFNQTQGEPWIISKEGVGMKAFRKSVNPMMVGFLSFRAAKAFAVPLWNQCVYYGWDKTRLADLLEETFDKMQAKQEVRFWR
jgi:hypothetical protein